MIRSLIMLALIASSLISPHAHAQETSVRNGFDLAVPIRPISVRVDGRWQISYEVHLTNFSNDQLGITRVTVLDAKDGHVLADLSGKALADAIAIIGTAPRNKGDAARVEPGQHAVVFLDFTVPTRIAAGSIKHRIDYTVAGAATSHALVGDVVPLSHEVPSVIDPPLRGGPWVAIHNSAWPRGHRRVFYTVAGHARLPGRFAVDWVKVDEKGRTTAGDPDITAETYGFGADVLAVADATVAAVRDGMDEPSRILPHTTHLPAEDAGNYVSLQLPDGRFAFYEHLRKGSIRVAVGDKVRTGDVIGSLGFSGESTGPHLHFHVADSNSTLDAESVPFEIRRFRRLGRYQDISKLGTAWTSEYSDEVSVRQNEWPDVNDVVQF